MQQRVAETHKKGRTKLELDLLYKGELFSSAEHRVIVEKFAQLCLSILVEAAVTQLFSFPHSVQL